MEHNIDAYDTTIAALINLAADAEVAAILAQIRMDALAQSAEATIRATQDLIHIVRVVACWHKWDMQSDDLILGLTQGDLAAGDPAQALVQQLIMYGGAGITDIHGRDVDVELDFLVSPEWVATRTGGRLQTSAVAEYYVLYGDADYVEEPSDSMSITVQSDDDTVYCYWIRHGVIMRARVNDDFILREVCGADSDFHRVAAHSIDFSSPEEAAEFGEWASLCAAQLLSPS